MASGEGGFVTERVYLFVWRLYGEWCAWSLMSDGTESSIEEMGLSTIPIDTPSLAAILAKGPHNIFHIHHSEIHVCPTVLIPISNLHMRAAKNINKNSSTHQSYKQPTEKIQKLPKSKRSTTST